MEFFRLHQRAIQMYDCNHSKNAGAAYKQHQLSLADWQMNLESVAVLQPIADWTQHMQGTKYPTLPLVLPTIYGLIDGLAPHTPLKVSFCNATPYDLAPGQLEAGVMEARTLLYDDFKRRWVSQLPFETKRTYAIAIMLHPCFKHFDFVDEYTFTLASDKAWAKRELMTEWLAAYKPAIRNGHLSY
eukprot:scaffold46765_cov39-Tisochrysis_lutea.AAC.1